MTESTKAAPREAWNHEAWNTVQIVPPTPFTADGQELMPERLGELVGALFAAGIRVFLPAAGTGEFHSLSVEEVLACVQATRKALGDAGSVFAPVGMGLSHALAIARGAAELGVDGLLLMPPVHSYLSDAGFRDYIEALTAAVPLPLLAYKRGPVPSDRLLLQLAAEGHLAGVKYAVNDMDAVLRFADAKPPELGLYCGTAERYAPFFMMAGATGYTSGAGNLCPRVTLALHAALVERRYDVALRWLRLIRPLEDFRAREADSFNISAIKAALPHAGFDFGPPRPPLRRLSSAESQELQRIVIPLLEAERELSAQQTSLLAAHSA